MIAVFAALAPIFLLILFGYGLRRGGVVPDAFWPAADRLTYFLFFPCLIVDELSRAKLAARDVLGMGTALEAGLLTGNYSRGWLSLGCCPGVARIGGGWRSGVAFGGPDVSQRRDDGSAALSPE